MKRALPQLNEHGCMAQELLACRRQRGSALVADEELPPKLLLQIANPRADRGLTDVQPLGRTNKTSSRNNLKERSSEFNIHTYVTTKLHSNVNHIHFYYITASFRVIIQTLGVLRSPDGNGLVPAHGACRECCVTAEKT
jgi:hypothetical protein